MGVGASSTVSGDHRGLPPNRWTTHPDDEKQCTVCRQLNGSPARRGGVEARLTAKPLAATILHELTLSDRQAGWQAGRQTGRP